MISFNILHLTHNTTVLKLFSPPGICSQQFTITKYIMNKTPEKHESFIKLWDKREKFKIEGEAQLKSYLYKIVYNGCLKAIKSLEFRVKSERGLVVVSDKYERDCLERMITAETIHLLYKAIDELPAQCRKVFTKLYVEGKSVGAAAAEMGLTISTIKNQKARGIKLLKVRVQK